MLLYSLTKKSFWFQTQEYRLKNNWPKNIGFVENNWPKNMGFVENKWPKNIGFMANNWPKNIDFKINNWPKKFWTNVSVYKSLKRPPGRYIEGRLPEREVTWKGSYLVSEVGSDISRIIWERNTRESDVARVVEYHVWSGRSDQHVCSDVELEAVQE